MSILDDLSFLARCAVEIPGVQVDTKLLRDLEDNNDDDESVPEAEELPQPVTAPEDVITDVALPESYLDYPDRCPFTDRPFDILPVAEASFFWRTDERAAAMSAAEFHLARNVLPEACNTDRLIRLLEVIFEQEWLVGSVEISEQRLRLFDGFTRLPEHWKEATMRIHSLVGHIEEWRQSCPRVEMRARALLARLATRRVYFALRKFEFNKALSSYAAGQVSAGVDQLRRVFLLQEKEHARRDIFIARLRMIAGKDTKKFREAMALFHEIWRYEDLVCDNLGYGRRADALSEEEVLSTTIEKMIARAEYTLEQLPFKQGKDGTIRRDLVDNAYLDDRKFEDTVCHTRYMQEGRLPRFEGDTWRRIQCGIDRLFLLYYGTKEHPEIDIFIDEVVFPEWRRLAQQSYPEPGLDLMKFRDDLGALERAIQDVLAGQGDMFAQRALRR